MILKPENISEEQSSKTYFHRQNNGIDHNQGENRVFKWRRSNKPPDFQLTLFYWNITFDRFSFQSKFNAFSLEKRKQSY